MLLAWAPHTHFSQFIADMNCQLSSSSSTKLDFLLKTSFSPERSLFLKCKTPRVERFGCVGGWGDMEAPLISLRDPTCFLTFITVFKYRNNLCSFWKNKKTKESKILKKIITHKSLKSFGNSSAYVYTLVDMY